MGAIKKGDGWVMVLSPGKPARGEKPDLSKVIKLPSQFNKSADTAEHLVVDVVDDFWKLAPECGIHGIALVRTIQHDVCDIVFDRHGETLVAHDHSPAGKGASIAKPRPYLVAYRALAYIAELWQLQEAGVGRSAS